MKNLELFYQLAIHEPSGLLVAETSIRPSHSFVVGFAKLMFNIGFGFGMGTPVAVTNTGGSSISTLSSMTLLTNAGTTVSTYGIQTGTGTGAESINDTSLGTQIAHGTSAGQLQYGSMTYGAPSTTATTTTFRLTRVFTNGSGGTVTVQEIGLVSGNGTNNYLWVRDLTGAVTVTNGQQLTVNYDFTTTI
jgi:hypothetical protein